MALIDYTTYETIRAVVGVAETEIPDDILAQPLYALEVQYALEDVSDLLPGLYATIRGKALVDRTILEKRLYELVQVYAAYWVGKVLAGGSIEMFAPKKITDGKATGERVTDPFSNLRADLLASLAVWRLRLSDTLGKMDVIQAAAPIRSYMEAVGLGASPILGV